MVVVGVLVLFPHMPSVLLVVLVFFLMGCCVFASLYHIFDPLDVSSTNFVGVWYWYVSLFFVLGGFGVGNLLLGGLLLVL